MLFDMGRWQYDKPLEPTKNLGPVAHYQLQSLLGDGNFNADGTPLSYLLFFTSLTDRAE